jgi:hypothetical protein
MHSERIDKSHSGLERAAKAETDKLLELQVAELTRQIHGLVTTQPTN